MGTPELWFRGEAAGGPVAEAGKFVHDFGDGMYLTDRFEVAKMYAETRTSAVDQQRIVAIVTDFRGRGLQVLDLRTDQRWKTYIEHPYQEHFVNKIKNSNGVLNEEYSQLFNTFLQQHKIDRSTLDVIIGPELVRGGNQVCIVQKGSAPSTLAMQLRSEFKAVTVGPPGQPSNATKRPYSPPQMRSFQPTVPIGEKLRRVARNQNAMAAVGIAFESGMDWLQQKGIAREVQRRIETDYRDYVQQAFNRGDGVLVIVYMQEWILPDVNGFHPKMMQGMSVHAGRTREEALANYNSRPNLTPGPSANCRTYEMYQWITTDG